METSLAGKLLVATPDLTDDLFARSVVLVLQHDEDTAEGVILNKPLDTPVDDVLPGWQQGSSRPQRVFQGGPVQLDSAIGLVGLPGALGELVSGVPEDLGVEAGLAGEVLVHQRLGGMSLRGDLDQ